MIHKFCTTLKCFKRYFVADCEKKREAIRSIGLIGLDAPECNEDGWYAREQYHGSTGFSWCVNPDTGAEIRGSRVCRGVQRLNCDEAEDEDLGFFF